MTTEKIPFVTAQISAIVEDIRLLEALVTAPVGLNADIKMLREALDLPEAADLEQADRQQRLAALRGLRADVPALAIEAVASLRGSLDLLGAVSGRGGAPFDDAWVTRTRRVLDRAEQRMAADLRARMSSKISGLYVIVDAEATGGRPVADVARAVLDGGTRVLQLRDKSGDAGDVLESAALLKDLCAKQDAIFIVNDDPAVAAISGADGIHLGQDDLPVAGVRRILRPGQIVGRSNNTLDEALDSQSQAVDYVAVGAVFPTTTMSKGTRQVVGVETVRKVKGMVSQPVVAIGGIDRSNVGEVVGAGADCVCVVSSVTMASDPEAAARQLVDAIEKAKG
jgi:thiamine-phosphate pyrophosphorylase